MHPPPIGFEDEQVGDMVGSPFNLSPTLGPSAHVI